MNDGAMLANSGHFDAELELSALEALAACGAGAVGAAGIALRRRLAGVDDPTVRADGLAIAELVDRSGGDPMLGPLTAATLIGKAISDGRGRALGDTLRWHANRDQ